MYTLNLILYCLLSIEHPYMALMTPTTLSNNFFVEVDNHHIVLPTGLGEEDCAMNAPNFGTPNFDYTYLPIGRCDISTFLMEICLGFIPIACTHDICKLFTRDLSY